MAVNDTSVDHNNLVEECFGISSALQGAMKDAGDAKDILDEKKSSLKYIKSKIWISYRIGELTIGDIAKPTDKAVDMAVECHPEVKEAQDEINAYSKTYTAHNSYAVAMETKKKSLELITRYALGGWFSDLKIADVTSIEKFADGIPEEITDTKSERTALRARRKVVTE